MIALMLELKKYTKKDYFVIGEMKQYEAEEWDVKFKDDGETENWVLTLEK